MKIKYSGLSLAGTLILFLQISMPLMAQDTERRIDTLTITNRLHVLFGFGEVAGNMAASIGDDGVLIVDNQSPTMAPYYKEAIRNLGGGDIDFALNTHWHYDHADGNKALGPEGVKIVAQANSRRMMMKHNQLNLVSRVFDQPAYPPAALPGLTFEDRMSIHFNGQQIDLMHFSEAHTTGDAAIYFRGDDAIHLGDVFLGGYPFVDADNGGTLPGMVIFCEAVLEEINPGTVVIPGHGGIAGYEDLADYLEMLTTVRDRIAALIDDGATLEDVIAAKPTAEWDEQRGNPADFVNRSYISMTRGAL